MKAIVLTGGLGRRLRPFTFTIPKPLIPVGDKPIVLTIVEHFKKFNIHDFIFATGWHSELIEAYFGTGKKFDVKITYVKEPKPLGTAGPLLLSKRLLSDDEPFVLINGDIVTKVNLYKFLNYHKQNRFDLTVGTITHEECLPFGVLLLENKAVKKIIEKPVNSWIVSAGIYIANKKIIDFIPPGKFFDMPSLIKKLISKKKAVGSYFIKEYWSAVENIEQLEMVNKILQKKLGKS